MAKITLNSKNETEITLSQREAAELIDVMTLYKLNCNIVRNPELIPVDHFIFCLAEVQLDKVY